jgi:hypothetical protein
MCNNDTTIKQKFVSLHVICDFKVCSKGPSSADRISEGEFPRRSAKF